MPMFHYEATDNTGKTVVGSMDARDEDSLRARLVQNGYRPTQVESSSPFLSPGPAPATGTAASPGAVYTSAVKTTAPRGQRNAVVVPNGDLTQFYRQMASMLGSGVSLPNAVAQLLPYTRNKYLKKALEDVEATVARGYPMSQALERHPRAFSAGHVGVIRSGEGGGFTVRALGELANQTEADVGIQTSAKFNPLLFLIRYAGIPFLAAWLVFMSGLARWTANLALLNTYFLRAAIAFVATIVVQAIAFPILAHLIRLSPLGRVLGTVKSVVPGLNAVQSRRDRVKTLASLSSALGAGVPLSLAWELSCEAADSDHFERRMAEQLPAVTRGGSVADAMGRTGLFTDRIMQIAHTGELSGNLPEMLHQATIFERDEAKHIGALMPWVIAVAAYVILLLVMAFFLIKATSSVYGGMLDNPIGQ